MVMEKIRELGLDSVFGSKYAIAVMAMMGAGKGGAEYILNKIEQAQGRGLSSEDLQRNFTRIVGKIREGKQYSRIYLKKY